MVLDLFGRTPIPEKIPKSMENAVLKVKRCRSKKSALFKAYDIVTRRFQSYKMKTYTRPFDLLINNIFNLWERTEFLHCTNQNFIMRILLVKSRHFKDKDLKLKWGLNNYFSPHQFLIAGIGKQKITVDAWGRQYGIEFGKRAKGFNNRKKIIELR